MSKKILVLYYSQTGQLKDIVENFLQPFQGLDVSIETHQLRPVNDYPFPWTEESFYDTMPESVLGKTVELKPFQLKENKYDLVVFAYQPWYLSLSIPANSIIQHPSVQNILKGTAVVTLIGSRNMWLSSQERLKKILKEAGANLVGNIALADRNQNHVSALTIMHWMFTGKKTKKFGWFPLPGISDKEILNTSVFGETVASFLTKENFEGLQNQLVAQQAVDVQPNYVFIEQVAPRLFSIWANIISKRKNRSLWLKFFKYYLLFALFIIAPIVLTVNAIFFRPFLGKKVKQRIAYYQGTDTKF
jgi:hypothetical protein